MTFCEASTLSSLVIVIESVIADIRELEEAHNCDRANGALKTNSKEEEQLLDINPLKSLSIHRWWTLVIGLH